ncbi:hypothetical protein MOQ_004074 [Trypanosoma cruzi marinkellei]|uniref:Kinesin n=1 Tax=Trypanosoma cruzi marinkellei TaxID=85056 RepID=K2N2E5_TRYCR|nr:hypothetical protein MOQ_004074 [Trypanosoma cruzi marinkellei]
MLVGVREYRREEIQRICGTSTEALVSYYTLLRNKNEAIMADVTDARARKNMNFDYYMTTANSLFEEAVRPIIRTVLPPISSPQVVVVVDGTETTRFHTLLDPEEGILALFWHLLKDAAEFRNILEAVYIAVVELDENNRLRDITCAVTAEKEPIIFEDAEDLFTSVEDASYMELRTEVDIARVMQHARRVALPERHQIFSFILAPQKTSGLPNCTIQFVALSVSEMARGMRSTRHCITTAASLIESRSPSMAFSGTKLSFLLKPALLAQQPGLWISCFAPTSVAALKQRETFKESFCIAHTLCRVYSSRVGVSVSEACQRIGVKEGDFSNENCDEQVEMQPRKDIPKPSLLGPWEKTRRRLSKTTLLHPSLSVSLLSSSFSLHSTPNTGQQQKEEEGGNSPTYGIADDNLSSLVAPQQKPTGLLVTPSERRTKSLDSNRTGFKKLRKITSNGRRSLSRSSHDRCSSLEKHPYNCSARYELETYKRVMEPAMNRLREDIQHYMTLLEDARRQIRRIKRFNNEEGEVEQLRDSLLSAKRDCASLEAEFTRREEMLQSRVSELQTRCEELSQQLRGEASCAVPEEEKVPKKSISTQTHNSVPYFPPLSSSPPPPPPPTAPLPVEDGLVASRTFPKDSPRKDVQYASHWFEVVNYHQRELEDYAERERSYRNRILLLEQKLSERESEMAQVRAELIRRDCEISLESVSNQRREHEKKMVQTHFEDVEHLRAKLFEANNVSSKVEQHLELCLTELKEERRKREASEAELRRLQVLSAQHMETGAVKEMIQMVKESYERHVNHLQREVEDLRGLAHQTASNEMVSQANSSTTSTPRQRPQGRQHGGMVSPAIETLQAKPMFSSKPSLPDENNAANDVPSTHSKAMPLRSEVRRFEDFMKEEPSYTIRLPKTLDRANLS